MDIQQAYKKLQSVGLRDAKKDDAALAEFADTRYWQILKESLLEPKIAGLLTMAGDVAKVMNGEESTAQFGEKAIIARIAAGHLQDIIDRVESAKRVAEEKAEKEALKKAARKK